MGAPAYDENWGDDEDKQDELVDGPAYDESWGDAQDVADVNDPSSYHMDVGDVQMGSAPVGGDADQHSTMHRLMAFGDGLVGNWGGELAGMLSRGGTAEGGESTGALMDQSGFDPNEQAGRVSASVDQASAAYPYSNAAGQVTSAVAAGAAAPAGALAQAGAGALHAGLSEYGSSHDLGRAGAAGAFGGAMAGGASMLGKGMGKTLGRPPEGPTMTLGNEAPMQPRPFSSPQYDGISPRRLQTMETYAGPAPQAHPAGPMPPPSAPPDLLKQLSGLATSPRKAMLDAGRQMVGDVRGNVPNQTVSGGMSAAGQGIGNGLEQLQRDHTGRVAADKSVVNWALKQTLSDNPGLTAKDTQDLNELVQTGNQHDIATRLYTLQQRSPLFAKQYERALRRANGDRE